MLGVGADALRIVPVTDAFTMDVPALQTLAAGTLASGFDDGPRIQAAIDAVAASRGHTEGGAGPRKGGARGRAAAAGALAARFEPGRLCV